MTRLEPYKPAERGETRVIKLGEVTLVPAPPPGGMGGKASISCDAIVIKAKKQ